MFGYSTEEFRSLSIRDLHPEQVLPKSAELFDRIQTEGQITAELLFRRKDRDVFTAEVASSLFDVDGTLYVQGILRDTTERKRMEAGLRESEERFLELSGSIREVFWILDIKRRKVLYASPAYETVWGRKLSDLYSDYGEEALEVFSEEHAGIDLVLLDMIMPRLSGAEVFPRLKRISPDVKVLLCSGFSRNESVEELISSGASGFLAKPFHLNDLSEAVSRLLSTTE
jgi:CheY-like chemotaxis protein